MPIAIRVRQLLSRNPKDLLWLGYVLGIAPWAHPAVRPLHQLRRWLVRYRRQRDVDHRMELLRARIACACLTQDGHRVAVVDLSPELDATCRPLRRTNEEIAL